jgi:hypothetical protein
MEQDLRIPKRQIEFTGRLFDYKEFRQYSDTFCETGNAAGDGLQRALDAGFKYIMGVEAQEMYYDMCLGRFKNKGNILLFLGKSISELPYILEMRKNNSMIFYLDAHVSGPTSFGYEDWVKNYEDWIKNGEESEAAQDKIIKAELNIILSNYNRHIICIDDVNGLSDGHAVEYMDLCLKYNPDYKFRFYDECLSGDKNFYYKDKILTAIL